MMPDLDRIYAGDSLEVMKAWPDAFVQIVVTSPPYWGLRDYGVPGQMGLEKTPEEYVIKMVEVFREVRRILRDDGTVWINLGDSYCGGNRGGYDRNRAGVSKNMGQSASDFHAAPNRMPLAGLKDKDLIGIPWRVAFALQADGWYLRSDIIWSKPNPMPESVTDRPTKAHEYLFLLSKSKQYFYDADAIKEPAIYREDERSFGNAGGNRHGDDGRLYKPPYASGKHGGENGTRYKPLPDGQSRIRVVRDKQRGHSRRHAGFNERWDSMEREGQCSAMRNKRSVWTVATSSFPEAHFATFPPDLIKPCVLAGSRHGDVVLDPFMGAGTAALVASEMGRHYLGIELNPEYVAMAERRAANEKAQMKMELK